MLSSWLYDQLLLVGTLVLWYVHHFPPLACNHVSTPSFCSTPPLIPSLRPHLLHTYDPPGPYFVPMRMAGDVAGPMLRLLGETDTPNAPECGPSDAQDA